MERNAGAGRDGHDEEPDPEREHAEGEPVRDARADGDTGQEAGRDAGQDTDQEAGQGAGPNPGAGPGPGSEPEPESDPGPEEAGQVGSEPVTGPGAEAGTGAEAGRGRGEAMLPADEEEAWAQIVAGYGEEPADPADGTGGSSRNTPSGAPGDEDGGGTPLRSFTVYAAGTGPRGWSAAGDDDAAEGGNAVDEGHFEPPEPPPLPQADTTAKFAWLAVIGGPLLLIFTIVFQVEMTWWIVTLGIGGFLGGFATLVARMRDDGDDDDWSDPGSGAVV